MFDNIGDKIKVLAQVICWVGIFASVITGFMLMTQDDTLLLGFLVILFGSLGSWIGSFMIYGFGQLIENADALVALSARTNEMLKKPIVTNETLQKESIEVKHKYNGREST